jgi:hypothetical protein
MTGKTGMKRGEREAAKRAERSRAALRENLKRRKAQAKEQGRGETAGIAPEKPRG